MTTPSSSVSGQTETAESNEVAAALNDREQYIWDIENAANQREEQQESQEEIDPEQFAEGVNEELDKPDANPPKLIAWATEKMENIKADFEQGNTARGIAKSAFWGGAAALAIWGTFKLATSISRWFRKSAEDIVPEGGIFGWLRERIFGVKEDSEKSIWTTVLGRAFATIGLGALGAGTISAVAASLAGKISFSELASALRRTESGEEPLALLHFLRELDLPPEIKEKIEQQLKEKVRNQVHKRVENIDADAAEAIDALFDDSSIDNALKQTKNLLQTKGIDTSFLDNIPRSQIQEQLLALKDVIGKDNMSKLAAGKDVVLDNITLPGQILGASGMTLILLALTRYMLNPLNVMKHGTSVVKKGFVLGGGTLGMYVALKMLGIDVRYIDGFVPDEIETALQQVDGQKYIDSLVTFMQQAEVMEGVKKMSGYIQKRLLQLGDEPYVQELIPEMETLKTLSGFDMAQMLYEEGKETSLERMTEEIGKWADTVGDIAPEAAILGMVGFFGLRKPKSSVLYGIMGFLAYCLYKDQEERGEKPSELLLTQIPSYMMYEGVERVTDWGKDFYQKFSEGMKQNPKTAKVLEEMDKLSTEKNLRIGSIEWNIEFIDILSRANLTAAFSETGMAIMGTGVDIVIQNAWDTLSVMRNFFLVGAEEAAIEYMGIVSPFVMVGAAFHPTVGMVIGGLVGAKIHYSLTKGTIKYTWKAGELIYRGPTHARRLLPLYLQQMRKADILAVSGSSRILSRILAGDPKRAQELLETLAKQDIELSRLGLSNAEIFTKYRRVFERFKDIPGFSALGVPPTLDEMIIKLNQRKVVPLTMTSITSATQITTPEQMAAKKTELQRLINKADSLTQKQVLQKQLAALQAYERTAANTDTVGKTIADFSLDKVAITNADEAQKAAQKLTRLAQEMEVMDAAMNLRVEQKMQVIEELAAKHGSKHPRVLRLMEQLEQNYLKPYTAAKKEGMKKLTAGYKQVKGVLGSRNMPIELVQQYKFAKQGVGGGFLLKIGEGIRGRALMAGVTAGIMLGVEVFNNDDPERDLWKIFDELGPTITQVLVDVLPFIGTGSLFTGAIAGQETVAMASELRTGEQIERGVLSTKQRWKNAGWGVVSLLGDIAMVGSAGIASPLVIAARLKKAGPAGKAILKVWPQLSSIMQKMGMRRFAESVAKFAKGQKTAAKGFERLSWYGVGGMMLVEGSDIAYSYLGEVDAISDEELSQDEILAQEHLRQAAQ